jgi:hypothetical protein
VLARFPHKRQCAPFSLPVIRLGLTGLSAKTPLLRDIGGPSWLAARQICFGVNLLLSMFGKVGT